MADDYKDLISEGDDFDGTIVMADEEGNEISFTFLDLLDYERELCFAAADAGRACQ